MFEWILYGGILIFGIIITLTALILWIDVICKKVKKRDIILIIGITYVGISLDWLGYTILTDMMHI